jgi:glycosyltransferase involved in cell wall biosynthesis
MADLTPATPPPGTTPEVTVVVPVRNAEAILEACLTSIDRQGPAEVIVVDGMSTDGTLEIARRHGARILSDEGRGLPAARSMGARAATTRWVALVDADVILPDGSLAALLREFRDEGYVALQAGLERPTRLLGPGAGPPPSDRQESLVVGQVII